MQFALACLLKAIAGSLVIVAAAAWGVQGATGLYLAIVAAAACGGVGVAAIAASSRFFRNDQAVVGIALAMALRAMPLLGVCLIAATSGPSAIASSFAVYLVIFYFAALAAETYASVQLIQTAR